MFVILYLTDDDEWVTYGTHTFTSSRVAAQFIKMSGLAGSFPTRIVRR